MGEARPERTTVKTIPAAAEVTVASAGARECATGAGAFGADSRTARSGVVWSA